MKSKLRSPFVAMLLAVAFGQASASSWRLDAISSVSLRALSGFSVEFTDVDNNQLLDLSEITKFSGMSDATVINGSPLYDELLAIPDISMISSWSNNGNASNGWGSIDRHRVS